LSVAIAALRAGAENHEISALAEQYQQRKEAADLYVEAYRRYCWKVHSLADLKLAPFHLLPARVGAAIADHVWTSDALVGLLHP
jgi:protein phosphatase